VDRKQTQDFEQWFNENYRLTAPSSELRAEIRGIAQAAWQASHRETLTVVALGLFEAREDVPQLTTVLGVKSAQINVVLTVGLLDRVLSEYLILTEREGLDEADAQTLKHHADDLIGVGQKALKTLKERGVE
jgi:hypothetical protein